MLLWTLGPCIFWSSVFCFFGCVPSSGIARLYGSSIFSFLRKLNTVFCSGWTSLQPLQYCARISLSPHSCQPLFLSLIQFSSAQSLSPVRLFATPWTAACQASLSITNSWSSLRFMSIESVMPSSHLILCYPFLLLPSIFPSVRVFFKWVSSLHQVAKVLEFQF